MTRRIVVKGQNTGKEIPVEVKVANLRDRGLEMCGDFLRERLEDGTEIFMLPQREEYRKILHPANWVMRRQLIGTREGRIVQATAEDKTVDLVIKPLRTPEELRTRHFDSSVFPPDAAKNIKKAQLIRAQMFYADNDIVVKYEMPIGYVKHPNGCEEEVFLAHPEALDRDLYLMANKEPKRKEHVMRCLEKIQELMGTNQHYLFEECDRYSAEFDVMFATDPKGRTVAIKYDTEFMRVTPKTRG
jgi:hypothetical protein